MASNQRLELLRVLRSPKPLHQIRVEPDPPRPGGERRPALSRQTITHHLRQLESAGLIERAPPEVALEGDRFVLNHGRLFAIIDELRTLARLRPVVMDAVETESTLAHADGGVQRLAPPPRLVMVYGRDEGIGFAVNGDPGSEWRIGRSRACEICLDYDPYASRVHAVVTRTRDGFELRDHSSNRNGTWLNWSRVRPLAPVQLESGDVIRVGRSLLVFKG